MAKETKAVRLQGKGSSQSRCSGRSESTEKVAVSDLHSDLLMVETSSLEPSELVEE